MLQDMVASGFITAVLLASGVLSVGATEMRGANPIRKVVTMLQDMQKSVEEEGKKEEDLFDKFMCYCSNGEGALEASITAGKAQIEQSGSAKDRVLQENIQPY